MKIKIKITKEILEKTAMCGYGEWKLPNSNTTYISENCAISCACCDVFDSCYTDIDSLIIEGDRIYLPNCAKSFIQKFDSSTPEGRRLMQPFEFEIEVPDALIEQINIDDIKNSKTLEIVS